jgi:hypothetical protein
MTEVPDEIRDVIVDVLCSQALADHLGDIRDAEEGLWSLIGVPPLDYEDPLYPGDGDSAWRLTKARLAAAGLPLPAYLRGDDEGDTR